MYKNLTFSTAVVFACTICFCVGVQAQTAASILEEAAAKDTERKKQVASYTVDQSVMGHRTRVIFERVTIESGGESFDTFRVVSGGHPGVAGQQATPTGVQGEVSAQGMETVGDGISSEMEKGLKKAGLPPGLFSSMSSPDEPWASPDPSAMTGGMAQFMRAVGVAQARPDAERAEDLAEADGMSNFMSKAKLVGEETVDGTDAFHLMATDLEESQKNGEQEFTIETVSMWIDKKNLVPLRFRMDGIADMSGEIRPVFVERISSDYRNVPGSSMYESYKQVMRMGGVMDAEQEAQLAEARQQLADFEQQMATMPDSQRRMMESMMGDQLNMMRNMANGGAYEIETTVHEISVNTE